MKPRRKSFACIEQGVLFPVPSDWTTPTELPDLRNVGRVALDTETKDVGLSSNKGPSWPTKEGHVCGISIAWRTDKLNALYLPVDHPDSTCFPAEQIKQWLTDHFNSKTRFTFHNAPYDIGWLNTQYETLPPLYFDDTGCMAYMIDENRLAYSLEECLKWRGLPPKDEKLLNEAAKMWNLNPKSDLHKLPARYVGPYAEQDGISTLLLAEDLDPELDKEEVRKAYDLEMSLVPMVHAMRKRGIRIDDAAVERAYAKFKKQSQDALDELTDRLDHKVGMDEIRSKAWLTKVFDHHKIYYPFTAKGSASFEAKWMKEIDHWLPRLVTRAKNKEEAAEKFIGQYIKGYLHNGRLHASVNQFKSEQGGGTRTYRFSYSDPPLQQIPHRDEEMAAEIRSCFLPEEGEKWLSADYSQQEYRLFVHYAASLNLPKAAQAAQRYIDNPKTDFHQWVADITGLPRKPAKDANFAVIYGAGVDKFSFMIKKPRQEAEAILVQYHRELPFARLLAENCNRTAKDRGYIKLLDGARIRFNFWTLRDSWEDDCTREEAVRRTKDPGHSWYGQVLTRSRTHKALNSLIQGGAARQTKTAMRDCWHAGLVPLLQVHDELCFSVTGQKQVKHIGEIMREAVKLKVPMAVDLETGPNWHHGK